MDELFQIDRCVGEVVAICCLQYCEEDCTWENDKREVFEEPPKVEEKKVELDEEGNPIEEEEAPAEEAAEEKKPKWNPAEFEWTISNRRSKNLPQLYKDFKGQNVQNQVRKASEFAENDSVAIAAALDNFCCVVRGQHYLYQ